MSMVNLWEKRNSSAQKRNSGTKTQNSGTKTRNSGTKTLFSFCSVFLWQTYGKNRTVVQKRNSGTKKNCSVVSYEKTEQYIVQKKEQ